MPFIIFANFTRSPTQSPKFVQRDSTHSASSWLPRILSALRTTLTSVLVSFSCQRDTAQSHGRETAQIRMVYCQVCGEVACWLIWEGQPSVGGAIPEQVILSCVTKLQEGECARDQVVSSIPPWSLCQLHALTSLSDRMWPQSVSHINPLLLKLFPFWVF